MKEIKLYATGQICRIVGASSRDRFALNKAYQSKEETLDFWIEALKPYDLSDTLVERTSSK